MPEKPSKERLVWIEMPEADDAIEMEVRASPDEDDIGMKLLVLMSKHLRKHALVTQAAEQATNLLSLLQNYHPESPWLAHYRSGVRKLDAFNSALNLAQKYIREVLDSQEILEQKPDDKITNDMLEPLQADVKKTLVLDTARAYSQCQKIRRRFGKTPAGLRYEGVVELTLENVTADECDAWLRKKIGSVQERLVEWRRVSFEKIADQAVDITAVYELFQKLSPQDVRLQNYRPIIEPLRVYGDARQLTHEIFSNPLHRENENDVDRMKRLQRNFKKSAGLSGSLRENVDPQKQPWEALFTVLRRQMHNSLQNISALHEKPAEPSSATDGHSPR